MLKFNKSKMLKFIVPIGLCLAMLIVFASCAPFVEMPMQEEPVKEEEVKAEQDMQGEPIQEETKLEQQMQEETKLEQQMQEDIANNEASDMPEEDTTSEESVNIPEDETATQENSSSDVAANPVFLEFTADWCPYCQDMKPTIEELENEYAGQLDFEVIDIDEQPDVANQYGVYGIPHYVLLDENGEAVLSFSGAAPKDAMNDFIFEGLGIEP